MYKTIIRRVLILIIQLFAISLFMFLIAYTIPGDVLTGLTEDPSISPQRLAEMRDQLGLNDPWPVQYGRWISGIVLRGDFGHSFSHRRPVMDVIGERLSNTFMLGLFTMVLIYLIAIPLGIIAGRYNDKLIDRTIGVYTYIALAMPTVVLALIGLLIFGFRLQWVPIRGSVGVGLDSWTFEWILSRLHHMILPAVTAALLGTVGIIQYLRGEIVRYKYSDFVTTARAKGVPERKLYSRHILRNALIPIASNMGLAIVGLFVGAVFIEQIFSFPGMGRLFLDAITGRDFIIVNAIVMIISALTALGVLLSDIILTVVDPRIRIR